MTPFLRVLEWEGSNDCGWKANVSKYMDQKCICKKFAKTPKHMLFWHDYWFNKNGNDEQLLCLVERDSELLSGVLSSYWHHHDNVVLIGQFWWPIFLVCLSGDESKSITLRNWKPNNYVLWIWKTYDKTIVSFRQHKTIV